MLPVRMVHGGVTRAGISAVAEYFSHQPYDSQASIQASPWSIYVCRDR